MSLRLLADIGGTNARFALAANDGLPVPTILPVAEFARFDDALEAFLADRGAIRADIGSCAIAAAGPVAGGAVRLTNVPWTIDPAEVGARLDCPVAVLNDLEAVACALPFLTDGDLAPLRAGQSGAIAPMIAVNVGTGFGAAVAVPASGGWVPLATEPGHMRLPDAPGTIEDVLSGPGLARLKGDTGDARIAFSQLLGRVTRDLVLATGAWGGVSFCGGVMGAWDTVIDRPTFDAAFDMPGPMADRLAMVPLARIIHPQPALLGLLHAPVDRQTRG